MLSSSASNSQGSIENNCSTNTGDISESFFSLEPRSNSDDVSAVFLNKPMRRGKWTPEEERYARTIIDAFEAGILQGVENGCTLRSCLSSRLHCAPMRISKKFAGKSIGKQVFLSQMTDMYGIALDQSIVRATMDRIRRLEQQFNISVLEEEGPISTKLEHLPSVPTTTLTPLKTVGNICDDGTYVHPLPTFLLQPQYSQPRKDHLIDSSDTSSVSANKQGNHNLAQPKTADNIANLFEAYQQAMMYHSKKVDLQTSSNGDLHSSESRPSSRTETLPPKQPRDLDNIADSDNGSDFYSSNYPLPFIAESIEDCQRLIMGENLQTLICNHNPVVSVTSPKLQFIDASSAINSISSAKQRSVLSSSGNPRSLSLSRNNKAIESVHLSAADMYADHARQSVLEVSKHSAYCKTLEKPSPSNMDISYTKENCNVYSNEISNSNSVTFTLGLYSGILNNIQQTENKRKSPESDRGPNEISGSDRSSDNCTNVNEGSWGDGSQNGVSTGTSDNDYSDTGSDEASIDTKRLKLSASALKDTMYSSRKHVKDD